METLNCPACGYRGPDTLASCEHCGAPLPRIEPTPASPRATHHALPNDDPFAEPTAISDSAAPSFRYPTIVVAGADPINLDPGHTVVLGRALYSPIAGCATDNVSTRHAEIRFDGIEVILVDTQSSNGTYLEGQRLAPNTEYRMSRNFRVSLATDPPFVVEVRGLDG